MATGKFNNVNVMEKSKNNKQPKRTNIKTKKNPKKKNKNNYYWEWQNKSQTNTVLTNLHEKIESTNNFSKMKFVKLFHSPVHIEIRRMNFWLYFFSFNILFWRHVTQATEYHFIGAKT